MRQTRVTSAQCSVRHLSRSECLSFKHRDRSLIPRAHVKKCQSGCDTCHPRAWEWKSAEPQGPAASWSIYLVKARSVRERVWKKWQYLRNDTWGFIWPLYRQAHKSQNRLGTWRERWAAAVQCNGNRMCSIFQNLFCNVMPLCHCTMMCSIAENLFRGLVKIIPIKMTILGNS